MQTTKKKFLDYWFKNGDEVVNDEISESLKMRLAEEAAEEAAERDFEIMLAEEAAERRRTSH